MEWISIMDEWPEAPKETFGAKLIVVLLSETASHGEPVRALAEVRNPGGERTIRVFLRDGAYKVPVMFTHWFYVPVAPFGDLGR